MAVTHPHDSKCIGADDEALNLLVVTGRPEVWLRPRGLGLSSATRAIPSS